MIIKNGKIDCAGCVLPLSHSYTISADLGTRHRAGVGVSEATDAVVVIVSEETGTISAARPWSGSCVMSCAGKRRRRSGASALC